MNQSPVLAVDLTPFVPHSATCGCDACLDAQAEEFARLLLESDRQWVAALDRFNRFAMGAF